MSVVVVELCVVRVVVVELCVIRVVVELSVVRVDVELLWSE